MALLQTLIDNFNAGLNLTKWDNSQTADPTEITSFNGGLKIAHGTNEYVQYISKVAYDLTSSYGFVQVLDRGDQSLTSHEVVFGLYVDSGNEVWFDASHNNLSAYKKVSGVQSQVGTSLSFDATNHKFWRFRESSGTLFWDTSADGVNWTNRWSIANPFAVTALFAELQSGCWQVEATGSYGVFDNFNTIANTKTFTTDGMIHVAGQKSTFTADGVVIIPLTTRTKTFTADGIIKSFSTLLTFFVDGLVWDKDPAELIYDNWYSGAIGTKWNNWAGGQASVVNKQLQIASILGGNYVGVDSAGVGANISYNFVESFAMNQLVDAGDQTITSLEVYPVYVSKDDGVFNFQVHFIVAGNVVSARKNLGGVTTSLWSTTYNPAVHKFFRIRETGGKIYFDYSTDGRAWTSVFNLTDPFTMTRVRIGQQIGTWEAEPRTTHATFDNFNCPVITLGAYDPDHLDVLTPLTDFEFDAGRKVGISMWYQGWDDTGDGTHLFQTSWCENVRKHGATPMITWEARRWWVADLVNQPDFTLANIIAGAWDAYITQFATDAKNWGHTLLLRPFHEMNGNWYPWGGYVNGNKAGELISAWIHVYNIFQSVGATNVKFVWSPNNVDPTFPPYSSLYPGDAYVDYVGVDSYNWGTSQVWSSWSDFIGLFLGSYTELLGITRKPFILPEFASTEIGGSKSAWITQTFNSDIFQLSRIVGAVWFNINKETDWRIESSPSAQAAFNAVMQLPIYSSYPLIDEGYDSKTSTVSDDWSSGVFNTTKWGDWSQGRASIISQSVVIHSELSAAYYGVGMSPNGVVHDFKESQVTCYLVSVGNQTLASFEVYPIYISMFANSSYQLNWLVNQGNIIAHTNVAGVGTTLYTTPYDATIHRFFRIRETAGVVYWDYSNDGITWINVASVADPFDLTFVDAGMQVGTYANELVTSSGSFDNFNITQIPGNTGIHGTQYGFYLHGIKLKNPIGFSKAYVYRRTDALVMSGKSVRDFTGLKQKYTMTFKNLTPSQVNDITAIMDLKTAVSFTVNGNDIVNVDTVVWPYIGSITYQTLGSNYLADATIELVEVDSE